jgi:uncharacterized membrane-anchored protein
VKYHDVQYLAARTVKAGRNQTWLLDGFAIDSVLAPDGETVTFEVNHWPVSVEQLQTILDKHRR